MLEIKLAEPKRSPLRLLLKRFLFSGIHGIRLGGLKRFRLIAQNEALPAKPPPKKKRSLFLQRERFPTRVGALVALAEALRSKTGWGVCLKEALPLAGF